MSEEAEPRDGASKLVGDGALPSVDGSGGTEGGASKPDPLHGVTLAMMLERLVDKYGWPGMAKRIRVNCFASDPSMASSLTFLRRTPWAREKVQDLYLYAFHGVMKPPSAWTLRGREMRAGKGGSGSKRESRDAGGPRREAKAPPRDAIEPPRAAKAPPREGGEARRDVKTPPRAARPGSAPAPSAMDKPAPKKPAPKPPRNPHY